MTTPTGDAGVTRTEVRLAIRLAVHAWIREDAPLTSKMNMMPRHVDVLVERVAAALIVRSEEADHAE